VVRAPGAAEVREMVTAPEPDLARELDPARDLD
jgi:hypothetical protein